MLIFLLICVLLTCISVIGTFNVPIKELIDRTLDASDYFIKNNDPRQAYVLIKRIISHPNASYGQRYRAFEGLADVFNVSRHVDIVARARIDITRSDRELDNMMHFLLQENVPYIDLSLTSLYENEFDSRNLDNVLQIARMEQVRWHADNLETMTTHRASAIAYGQLGEYDKAIAHFALCEKTGEGFDGSDCAHKLKYTQLRQKEGNIAKIAERSTQIYAERTINAARSNFANIYELYHMLRDSVSPVSAQEKNKIMSIIFECRKYLYYNGWLTPEEAVDNVEVLWKNMIETKNPFAVDTLRIFRHDVEFAEWRRNGSEALFWKEREDERRRKERRCNSDKYESAKVNEVSSSATSTGSVLSSEKTRRAVFGSGNANSKAIEDMSVEELDAFLADLDDDDDPISTHSATSDEGIKGIATDEKCSIDMLNITSDESSRPYVLRFVTAGTALNNFGHAQHDGLWPFIITHNLFHRFADRPTAPIFVLDMGIFLLKFLRLAYPNRSFVGFRQVHEVPIDAEEVIISGLGLPKPFDYNVIRKDEMKEVRNHMLAVCSRDLNGTKSTVMDTIIKSANKVRLLLIRRELTDEYRVSNDERVEKDCADDHPSLKRYVDGGMWSQSVLCSKRVQGSNRRSIKNFDEVLEALTAVNVLPNYVEVVPFNPEAHSYCEQVMMFANAKVVIGQHGAALSHIGYMSPGSVVLELENILNAIFKHIAEGSGHQYVPFHMHESRVYLSMDRAHVTLNVDELVPMIRSIFGRS